MEKPYLNILHLEDLKSDAELVEREIKRSGILFNKLVVDNKSAFMQALRDFAPDIILSDHSLPSFNSLEVLKILQEDNLQIPVILITATVSEEFAVDIMKKGAYDYILKDRLQRLPSAILNAMDKYRLEKEKRNTELLRLKLTTDLMRRNKDLEQFTYIVSHNLRAPVANIIGFCNILEDDSFDEASKDLVLEQMGISIRKLDQIIRDLNFILEDKKDVNLRKTRVSLSEIVHDVLTAAGDAVVNTDFTPVPDISTVRSYLRSIFYNLIANCIRHQRGRPADIIIRSYRRGKKVAIDFSREAHGDQADTPQSPQPFHEAEDVTALDMFMVKTLVEMLGGDLHTHESAQTGVIYTIEMSP